MAPSGKRIKARRRRSSTAKPRRRTHYKKLSKILETSLDAMAAATTTSSSITYSKTIKRKSTFPNDSKGCSQTPEKKSKPVCDSNNSCNQTQESVSVLSPDRNGACSNNGDDVISSGCSTPKGHRFRIPEILTCPRAPMKRGVLQNCSMRRGPIAFFAPPDIELFFLFALGDVPAA